MPYVHVQTNPCNTESYYTSEQHVNRNFLRVPKCETSFTLRSFKVYTTPNSNCGSSGLQKGGSRHVGSCRSYLALPCSALPLHAGMECSEGNWLCNALFLRLLEEWSTAKLNGFATLHLFNSQRNVAPRSFAAVHHSSVYWRRRRGGCRYKGPEEVEARGAGE